MDLIVIGAGGFGREVMWQIESSSLRARFDKLNFADDSKSLVGSIINGHKVLCDSDALVGIERDIGVCICIADPHIRRSLVEKLSVNPHISFPSIIMPDAVISDSARIGAGAIICSGCLITVNVDIGDFFIANPRCCITHDDRIGDYVTLYYSVNISGNVHIGSGSQLGSACVIRQGLSIGDNAFIGAGAAVVCDISDSCTAVGVPARVIQKD